MKIKAKSMRVPPKDDAMHRWGQSALHMDSGGVGTWDSVTGPRNAFGGTATTAAPMDISGIPNTTIGAAAGVPPLAPPAVDLAAKAAHREKSLAAAAMSPQFGLPGQMAMPAGLALRDGGEYRMASGGGIPAPLPPPPVPQTPIPDWFRHANMCSGGALRMGDGGFLSAIKPNFMKSSAERFAEYKNVQGPSPAPIAAPAPMPAALPPTAAPMVRGFLDPKNALRTREQAAGLADGGAVPGHGEGDKVPALYEPGEFVVSNDMLDKAPGLREGLHSLRKETLESQGKTVAQADAARMKGGRLRAATGIPGVTVDEIYNRNVPRGWYSQEASDFRAQNSPNGPPRPAAPPEPAAPRGYKAGQAAARGYQRAKGFAGSNPTAGAAALSTINSAWDAGHRDTADYYHRLGMDPADTSVPRDLAARTAGVMTDVGAGLLDLPVDTLNEGARLFGGKGDFKLPGGSFRDIVQRNDAPAPTTLRPDAGEYPGWSGRGKKNPPQGEPPTQPLTVVAPDVGTRSLRQGLVPEGEGGVVYRKGNSFSGRDISNYGNQSVVPGMSKELIDQTLTNPDGSRWSAADNSRMAANLRDGVDPYAGTSRQPNDGQAQLQRLALSPLGTPGRSNALRILTNNQNNATALSGQQVDRERNDVIAQGHASTAKTAANAARLSQMNSDRTYALDVEKFGEEQAKTRVAQRSQADKDLTAELEAQSTTRDKNGKAVVDQAAVAAHKSAALALLGIKIAKLREIPPDSPGYKDAQRIIDGLEQQGPLALGRDGLQRLKLQLEVQRRSAAADSIMPWGGSHVDSVDPRDYDITGRENHWFKPDNYVARGGSRIPTRVLERTNEGSPLIPNNWVDTPTNRFENIIPQRLRDGP